MPSDASLPREKEIEEGTKQEDKKASLAFEL